MPGIDSALEAAKKIPPVAVHVLKPPAHAATGERPAPWHLGEVDLGKKELR
jgi:hypothetical protein